MREIMNRTTCHPDTDVAVIHHAFWKDQKIIKGIVSDITEKVEKSGIKHCAIIRIGEAANPKTILTLNRGEPNK